MHNIDHPGEMNPDNNNNHMIILKLITVIILKKNLDKEKILSSTIKHLVIILRS